MLPLKEKQQDEEKQMLQQFQLEQELCSLRKEYNTLDRDVTHTQQHGFHKMSKNKKVFSIFKNEYKNILTNLAVATTPEKKREDSKMYDYLNFLVYEYGAYGRNVKAEKVYMQEMEEQIKAVKKSVDKMKKNFITDRQHEDRCANAIKIVAKLENNLETQVNKFNLVCAKNRNSREEIDHLLWNRRNFMDMWKRFIEKLSQGKKVMLDLIEQATVAYDQREDWCNKLQSLRIKAHNDLLVHIDEMRELKRRKDHAKKLEDFYNIKGMKRILLDLQEKERQKRAELQEKLQQKLAHYQEMMADIMEFTKESKTDVLATKYYIQEEQNFMYFSYVNDLIREMESLNDNLGFFHLDIEERKFLSANRVDQQKSKLISLEKNVERATEEATLAQLELEELNSNLDAMMQGIDRLFKLCKCNQDPLLTLLGANMTVQHYNVSIYLQILEKSIHECLIKAGLRDKVLFEKKKITPAQKILAADYRMKMQIYSLDEIVQTNPCALCVENKMVNDVVDTVERVWSRREAKRQLAMRLSLPDGKMALHSISRCHMPKARRLLQKRYE